MLPPQGVAELAKVLAGLKAQGLATILITHKLHEAVEMGDRISILKQGRRVGSLDPDELRSRTAHEAHDAIIGMMFGGEAATVAGVSELREEADAHRRARDARGAPLLELIHVSARGDRHGWGIDDVTLDVLEGEILGIAGVDGNGQKELAEAIAGQRRLSAGEIRLDGRSVSTLSVAQRERRGLRYVTDDRLGEGTVRGLSVAMNLVVKRIGQAPFWRRGTTRHVPINAAATKLVDEFDVRTPSVSTRVSTLSGGNLQKVVLARELSFDPRVVVYSKPTHGLDVKTTLFVRERIRQQADQGLAQLVISTDLEELLDLCDRIAVMFRGRCAGVVDNAPGI
ncbi:MAG: ATP-binding cassette domain-containing protein, partial [Gaiellales bacterium]